MSDPKYEAGRNNEGFDCVIGKGNGLGYYAHTLNEGLTCRDKEESTRAAKIANIAYATGYEQAQYDIRKSMGLDK